MYRILLLALFTAGKLFAGNFYVNVNNTSPAPPYNTPSDAALYISNATALAASGDVIHFATGTYYLTEAIVVTNDVSFVSTNPPGTVVIDGGLTTKCFDVSESAPGFYGLTIENGNSDFGGAMRFYFSEAVISNCIIRNSRAQYGGGIYADQSPVLITDCVISGNIASNNGSTAGLNWPYSAGGGVFFKTSSALLENSVIANNQALLTGANNGGGGGICVFHPEKTGDDQPKYAAKITVDRCLIISNSTDYTGGGTACLGVSLDRPITKIQTVFTKCRWEENTAQYGGAFFHVNQGTEPVVINSLFLRNSSSDNGAAIRVFDNFFATPTDWSRCSIFNSTIVDNRSTNNHAIYVSDSIFYMVNCIVWSNQTLSDIRVDSGTFTAPYQEAETNCLERDYTGEGILNEGNITNNPVFADTGFKDFRLRATSPCIDIGHKEIAEYISGYFDVSDDYFSDVRIFGESVDMGFDEAVVAVKWAPTSGASSLTALCPPGSILSLQQSSDANMSDWQDIGLKLTSMTDQIEFDVTGDLMYTGAIRAVWHRP